MPAPLEAKKEEALQVPETLVVAGGVVALPAAMPPCAPMGPVSSPRLSACSMVGRGWGHCFLTTPPAVASLSSLPLEVQVLPGPEPSRSSPLSLLCPSFSAWWQWVWLRSYNFLFSSFQN